MILRPVDRGARTRTSSPQNARGWKRLSFALAITMTGACIGGYALLSITVNGLPPVFLSDGQAVFFQPASESKTDTIDLFMDSDAEGDHPFVQYQIDACGPRPYNGYLLLNQGAQLSHIERSLDGSAASPSYVQEIPEEYPTGSYNPNKVRFPGHSQLIKISIPEVVSCRSSEGRGIEVISGFMEAPLQQNWSGVWGLWHGPHASQSWPNFGPLVETGKFTIAGVNGDWASPPESESSTIQDVDSRPWSVDSSVPAPEFEGQLSWSTNKAIDLNPIATITDAASVALIQDWIVILAIGVGIGGGLLASVLYEQIRPQTRHDNQVNENTRLTEVLAKKNISPVAGSTRLRSWLFGAGVFSLAAWAYRAYRRRNRS
jgi:hypothetical protein